MGKRKLKIGLYSFACCEGCIFNIFELNEKILKLLEMIEIRESRHLLEKNIPDDLDAVLIEGAIVQDEDIEKLKMLREKAPILVAMGACAITAGIPGIRNTQPEEVQKLIEKNQPEFKPAMDTVHSLDELVRVDYYLRGCPCEEGELLWLIAQLYHGSSAREEDVAVCFECKQKENQCLLLTGKPCLGPVTHAGCGALCPSQNVKCIGCRGFSKDANLESMHEKLKEIGIEEEEIRDLFVMYNKEVKKDA